MPSFRNASAFLTSRNPQRTRGRGPSRLPDLTPWPSELARRANAVGASSKAGAHRRPYQVRMESNPCGSCGALSSVRAKGRAWWLVVGLAWVPLLLVGACCALLLPLNLVLVPMWLACATAVGALARRATEPRCGVCGASGARLAAAEVARRDAGPAQEGAMEGALIRKAREQRDLGDGPHAVA